MYWEFVGQTVPAKLTGELSAQLHPVALAMIMSQGFVGEIVVAILTLEPCVARDVTRQMGNMKSSVFAGRAVQRIRSTLVLSVGQDAVVLQGMK
jgi:hypothetical protein